MIRKKVKSGYDDCLSIGKDMTLHCCAYCCGVPGMAKDNGVEVCINANMENGSHSTIVFKIENKKEMKTLFSYIEENFLPEKKKEIL